MTTDRGIWPEVGQLVDSRSAVAKLQARLPGLFGTGSNANTLKGITVDNPSAIYNQGYGMLRDPKVALEVGTSSEILNPMAIDAGWYYGDGGWFAKVRGTALGRPNFSLEWVGANSSTLSHAFTIHWIYEAPRVSVDLEDGKVTLISDRFERPYARPITDFLNTRLNEYPDLTVGRRIFTELRVDPDRNLFQARLVAQADEKSVLELMLPLAIEANLQ